MCPELVLIPPFDSSGADKPGMGAKLLHIRGAVTERSFRITFLCEFEKSYFLRKRRNSAAVRVINLF